MRANEFLTERALAPADFYKQERIDNFIQKMKSGQPFLLAGGGQVTLKRTRDVMAQLASIDEYSYKEFPRQFITSDNRPVALNQLEKTKDFGGQSAIDNPGGKEALPLKPSQIGITGTEKKFNPDSPDVLKVALATGAFRAGELGSKIIANPTLRGAGAVGKAVIQMANEINNNQVPTMPNKTQLPVPALKGIRDYAGEYLGIQQLVTGTANFPNSDAFFKFMGVNQQGLQNLILYFPASSNTPLADSLALQNKATGHVIKLSSKGADKGAPPSMDNLKIPDALKKEPTPEIQMVIGFLEEAHASSARAQPFKLMQYIINKMPDDVPEHIRKIFPVSDAEYKKLLATESDKWAATPQKFVKLANIKSAKTGGVLSGAPFGRVHYQLNNVIADLINKKNIFPEFRSVVLMILGYNFVQVFSRERQGKLFADVLWPGTVNGKIEIYSKASSKDPGSGKMSFSVTD